MNSKSSIILGIDPGTQVMGYAILKASGNNLQVLLMDVLKMSAKDLDNYARLEKIYTKVSELVTLYRPTTFAIEAPFFGKNVQSMLKLGRAQGVAIAAAMQAGLIVTEYSPKKVKQSVTGKGTADKEQVWQMLKRILNIEDRPQYFDATDALAVALCHHYQSNSVLNSGGKGVKGWEGYLKNNPDKIISK